MYCPKCGKELNEGNKFCDACGTHVEGKQTEQGNNNKPHGCLVGCGVLSVLFLILFFFMIIVVSFSSDTTSDKPKLEVIDSKFCTGEYGVRSVCGTIRNNTNKNYGYAQVSINLYDKNGNLINSTMDNINNLGPNNTWKFKAVILENGVSKYDIKDVTGF